MLHWAQIGALVQGLDSTLLDPLFVLFSVERGSGYCPAQPVILHCGTDRSCHAIEFYPDPATLKPHAKFQQNKRTYPNPILPPGSAEFWTVLYRRIVLRPGLRGLLISLKMDYDSLSQSDHQQKTKFVNCFVVFQGSSWHACARVPVVVYRRIPRLGGIMLASLWVIKTSLCFVVYWAVQFNPLGVF